MNAFSILAHRLQSSPATRLDVDCLSSFGPRTADPPVAATVDLGERSLTVIATSDLDVVRHFRRASREA
jgi:hypothetical protein